MTISISLTIGTTDKPSELLKIAADAMRSWEQNCRGTSYIVPIWGSDVYECRVLRENADTFRIDFKERP